MRLGVLAIAALLAACSIHEKAENLSCKAQLIYNSSGPDRAIEAFEDLGHERDYVVANNLARYLILRGYKTDAKADFDRANSILEAMEMPKKTHPLTAKYVAMLRFLAITNGSHRPRSDTVFSLDCHRQKPGAACATQKASEVLTQLIMIEGSKSQTTIDLIALYSRTHQAVFGSAFERRPDEWSKHAEDFSYCAAHGVEEPGTTHFPAQ